MAITTTAPKLPIVSISMLDTHTISVIIPGTGMLSHALTYHLAAEYCEHMAKRGEYHSARYYQPAIKKERFCIAMRIDIHELPTSQARQDLALDIVQRLECAVPKYARDEAGMATYRVIVST